MEKIKDQIKIILKDLNIIKNDVYFRSTESKYIGKYPSYNIKMYNIRIPDIVKNKLSDEEIEYNLQFIIEEVLKSLIDNLKKQFNWIIDIYQEGRSGGYLVLINYFTEEELYNLIDTGKWLIENKSEKELEDDEFNDVEDFLNQAKEFIKISDDLITIYNIIEDAKIDFLNNIKNIDFWNLYM